VAFPARCTQLLAICANVRFSVGLGIVGRSSDVGHA
jgi:hypothetical protein